MHATSTIHKKYPWFLPGLFSLLWVFASLWIARPWIEDIADAVGWLLAGFIFWGLAMIPGYLALFLFWSILLENKEPLEMNRDHWPPLSVLIAAFNEEQAIQKTIRSVWDNSYPGKIEVWLIDDGSTDRTTELARAAGAEVIALEHGGKADALNEGVSVVDNELLVFVDADTFLEPGALQRIVARMLQEDGAGAVAGSLYVDKGNWMNNLQHWDYHLSIAAVKRSQATLGATLVAQGAFSLYRRSFLLAVDPWVRAAGEDIVVSWQMLRSARILFEPTALACTTPPQGLRSFWRQRVRWARGMIEGLHDSGSHLLRGSPGAKHGVLVNSLFPFVDTAYSFVFLPGVVLLLLGETLFVGLWTLLLLPLQGTLFLLQYQRQRSAFSEAGVGWRKAPLAFWGYIMFYQAFLSPAALLGYIKEILGRKKRW